MRRPGMLARLAGDTRGATAVEFSLVLPLLLLFVIGGIEIAIVLFIGSSIESAVLEASRYGITGGTVEGVTREARVLEVVEAKTYGLLDMEEVEMETFVYESFADIGEPEPWEDDGNGTWETGEVFTDVNGNGVWDADMGEAGLGGPSDVVVYRLSYDWGIITPFMAGIIGESVRHVSAVAVRNEPF